MSETAKLTRTHFSQSRDREYFDKAELATMTGQSVERFPDVVIKELADNALDAAEKAGVPPRLSVATCRRKGKILLRVRDNGGGLPPDVIQSILDFKTRTSDKAAYRSPTRGLQGNALKTILGIPYALGCRWPLMIEARGKRHNLQPRIDPAGNVHVIHRTTDVEDRGGTAWTAPLPTAACGKFDLPSWIRGYAIFNPHAFVKFQVIPKECKLANSPFARTLEFYKPTASFPKEWTKFLPTDLIPIAWYDAPALSKLVFNHIANARQGDANPTLREFVTQFPGFKSTTRTARVCDALPGIDRLSDFESKEKLIAKLLATMQAEAGGRTPRPEILGIIGEEHFFRCFDDWYSVKRTGEGKARFWYAKACLEENGVPYVFEVAFAETSRPGRFFHGVNFSPTFADPFAGTQISSDQVSGFGLEGFLQNAHAYQSPETWGGGLPSRSAVAVHLVSPALQFLDKGKTKLSFDSGREIVSAAGEALWKVTKIVYKEEERRKRDAAKQQRADQALTRKSGGRNIPLTKVMDVAMPESLHHATGGKYRVSAHTLFYTARRVFQKYTSRFLESQYFEQTLLPEYLRSHPDIAGRVYREARGTLYEPHTGKELPLGTREVEDYKFPSWRYRSILFVEKQGLYPALKEANLGERYDLAIIAGEGFATEACRVLFAKAEEGNYQLFVLHDADPWGYNIARTLREETARMPGYKVEVHDLGLNLQQALDLGLDVEDGFSKKKLPQLLQLSPLERQYFSGEKTSGGWPYKRVELNAFTVPGLIKFTEDGLQKHCDRWKVIPDAEILPSVARPICEGLVNRAVQAEILRRVPDGKSICESLIPQLIKEMDFGNGERWIRNAFANDPATSWDEVVEERMEEVLTENAETIKDAVDDLMEEASG